VCNTVQTDHDQSKMSGKERPVQKISLICHNSVTNQNVWFFRRDFKSFEVL